MKFISSVLLGALVFGCGSSTDGEEPTVEFRMDVIGFTPGMGDVPLEGVEVCVLDSDNCDTSDSDGFVTLTLPANSEVTLSVLKEGYTPTLSPQLTGDQDVDELRTALLDEQTSSLLAGVLGTEYPLVGGVVAISALFEPLRQDDNGIAGITFTSAGSAPYYLNESGFPTYDIEATTEPDGAGGFVELDSGVYEVVVGGAASNCEVASAWPGSTDDSIRLPVADGFFTQAFIACDAVEAP
jgi:hypothetical protein